MTVNNYRVYYYTKPSPQSADDVDTDRMLCTSKDAAMNYAKKLIEKDTTLRVEIEEHTKDLLTDTICSIKTIYEKEKV